MSKKKDKKLQDYEKNLKRYSKAHLAVELNDIKRKRIINNTLQILVDAMLLGGEVYLINELIEFLGNIGIEMNVENKLLAGLSIWLSFSSLILLNGSCNAKEQRYLTKKENIVCKYLDADEEIEKEKETEESKILR